jgi:hypothetical protein
VAQQQGNVLNERQLVHMVTKIPAELLGWEAVAGSLKTDALADVVAISGVTGDPYHHLVSALEKDMAPVVIHGIPRYGDDALMRQLGTPSTQESVTVDGVVKRFFFQSASSPLNGLSLRSAISRLKEAMGDLKAIQQQVLAGGSGLLALDTEPPFELVLDMHPVEDDRAAGEGGLLSDDDNVVESMPLDGLFVDEDHLALVDGQTNLHADLKEELRRAYS